MPKRQLVITKPIDDSDNAGTEPLGDRKDVFDLLGNFNMHPDVLDGEFLYGPGLTVHAPMTGADEVNQLLVVLIDEDFAWPVITRLCQKSGWRLMDPESGRTLTF